MRREAAMALILGLLFVASTATAQSAPPAQPSAAPPPPGYAPYGQQPPYGYPGYGYPQYPYPYPPQQPAPWRPGDWKEGDQVPAGYHVENKPRSGLVTAGFIVTVIPYGLGIFAASSSNFSNASAWLAVPFAGPWMTLGQRHYGCDDSGDPTVRKSVTCLGDVFAVMGLVADGVVQTAGGTLLLLGYTLTKPTLVQDERAVHVAPGRVGSGYGLTAVGAF